MNSIVGKWVIDPSHSAVTFSVRHLMISKVKGSFGAFKGEADLRENLADSTIAGIVDVTTINTKDEARDGHLRSADFFDVENYPTMSFITTKWEGLEDSHDFTLTGELTIKDVTRPVTFKGEFGGVQPDGYGNTKAGLELTTKINRTDFGLTWNSALETGGVLVGEEVTIVIDAQAVLVEDELEPGVA
jgi:polyisoprenoid-binding protein YceI